MKHSLIIFLLGSFCGVFQWLAPEKSAPTKPEQGGYQWPTTFEGVIITPLPMTAMEKEFGKDFPGAIGNFRCGDQQIILRHVTRATRKLHPAAHCLRAAGHSIGPVKIHTDADGHHWSGCYTGKGEKKYFLRERIVQIGGKQAEWTDVSSWHWHALLAPNEGPWLSITVISEQ